MRRTLLAACAVAVIAPAFAPPLAAVETARERPIVLREWQARWIVRAGAALEERPDFRIERTRQLGDRRVLVCWSEPGYLPPERDYGCDRVELRRRQFWRFDDSTVGEWRRVL